MRREIRLLNGSDDLTAARTRISAIAQQPDTEYPAPTGTYPKLYNAPSNSGKQRT